MQLDDDVTTIKFISSKYSTLLEKLGIYTVKDLLTYFPVKYSDSTETTMIKDLIINNIVNENIVIKARVQRITNTFLRGGGRTIQVAVLVDGSGEIKATWFNQKYLASALKPNKLYLFKGKIQKKGNTFTFYPNIYDEISDERESVHLGRIVPEYSLTEGVSRKWFRNRVNFLLENIGDIKFEDEILDSHLSEIPEKALIKEIHFPTNSDNLDNAIKELSKHELANIILKVAQDKENIKHYKSVKVDFDVKTLIKNFLNELSYELTTDQLKIVNALSDKLCAETLINELIQGDVGTGKTIIAVILSLIIAKAGYQAIVLAPTTILAKQHYVNFKELLTQYDISVELVSSENKKAVTADILIGTSAVLARQKDLIKKPGLIIVDEQHRFGVSQREDLLKPFEEIFRENSYPHFINMTATPIPRTIAQSFFGDIEVSQINTKPRGRLTIKSYLVEEKKRKDSYEWIKEQIIKNDGQAYWVCPLVLESDKLEVKSAEATFSDLKVEFKGIKIGLIHGQMKEVEKSKAILDFREGKTKILVSTSVIEVGVDVPNASIIVIENSERFGLAQLHQMRGRVGRSDKQSWCFFYYGKNVSEYALNRLKFIAENSDGLKVAEFDLQNRGPGEIYGLRQSGIPNLKIASLSDIGLIKESKTLAEELFKKGITQVELFS